MKISKTVRTLLATGFLAAGTVLAEEPVSSKTEPSAAPVQKTTDLTRPMMRKRVDSYLKGANPDDILDVGKINAYGVKGYLFTFVTGQQATLMGDTFYVRQQKVAEKTLVLMRQMRAFRRGEAVEGLRVSDKLTKIGDLEFYPIRFPNGERGRLSADGTVTYPVSKTPVREKDANDR